MALRVARHIRLVQSGTSTPSPSLPDLGLTFLGRDTVSGSDQQWSWGAGLKVTGPTEALTMSVSGRAAALPDVAGAGAEVLSSRMKA